MIQFNLLPDVKIEYIKAQKMRQTFLSVSVLVTIVAVVVFGLSFGANQLEKSHLNGLNKDVTTETNKLKSKDQIDRILTVQNQLNSLTTLHDGKPNVPQLFDYLNQITPDQVTINTFGIDFNLHTVTVVGGADSLTTVNKYVDTLKFTTYTSDTVTTDTKAFSNVVLSAFGITTVTGNQAQAQSSSYTITFAYDPNIFDNKQKIVLKVPSIITTRSEVDKPSSDLFTKGPANQTPANPGGSTTQGGK